MSKLRCCFCGRDLSKTGGTASKVTEEAICDECVHEIVMFRYAREELAKRVGEVQKVANEKQ